MNMLKSIALFIVLSFVVSMIGYWLESAYLFVYLKQNIIGLLLTLLAINIASLGLIASKIQDLLLQLKGIDFSETIYEMKMSLREQIGLIIAAVVILMLDGSEKISFEFKDQFFNTLLLSVLFYAVQILWDSGKGVFVVIEEINKLDKQ